MRTEQPAILILTPGFPANETDGNCLPAIQHFVRSLKAAHKDVEILVLSFQYPFKAGAYEWEGCWVVGFGGRNRRRVWRLLLWAKIWRRMAKLNKQYNIRSILSFWLGEAALLGKRFGERHNIPHYCWLQGQDARKDNRYVTRVKPDGQTLIAISDFIARTLSEQHGIQAGKVIPIGVKPLPPVRADKVRDIDIIAAGSLIPLKQYDLLLDIVILLKQSLPGVKVTLCGDGPEAASLHQKIAQKNLGDNVMMTGELPHSVLLRMMQRSKLFLHTSSYEGMSTVCLEALAAGAVVLSFCQPMAASISNWHVVATKEQMAERAAAFLSNDNLQNQPVIPFDINETVAIMSKLLLQQAT